jgi:uridine kinase
MRVTASTKPNSRGKPFILGVSGGSGSGKTYFARDLMNALGSAACAIVHQDCFYIDQSKRFDYDGGAVNFDHPSSIDFACLAECLEQLRRGEPTEIPDYDFTRHARKVHRIGIPVKPLIIVDGILIFHSAPVRRLLDDLIYFNTPEELRFQRRLERDVNERGRKPEGVRQQFFSQVKPMHDQYVEPSSQYAKHIVSCEAEYQELLMRYREKFGGGIVSC